MKRQWGMKLVLGFVVVVPPISSFGQQTGTERGVPIIVVVQDRANVKPESLAVAKQVVIRVMSAAGLAVTYIDTQDGLGIHAPLTGSSEHTELSRIGSLTVVITPEAYLGSGLNEAGFAAVTAGPYRRAYVFLDRVKYFSEKFSNSRYERIVGVFLGHVICHELGHLLMPNRPHPPSGIMRTYWDAEQWTEANQGLLLFSRKEGETMRGQIQDHCSAALARIGRPC